MRFLTQGLSAMMTRLSWLISRARISQLLLPQPVFRARCRSLREILFDCWDVCVVWKKMGVLMRSLHFCIYIVDLVKFDSPENEHSKARSGRAYKISKPMKREVLSKLHIFSRFLPSTRGTPPQCYRSMRISYSESAKYRSTAYGNQNSYVTKTSISYLTIEQS